jgi:hypothetical protein
MDPLSDAILVAPLFLIYQAGILSGRGQNGVDMLTRALVDLAARDLGNYLLLLALALATWAALLVLLRRAGRFNPGVFVPMALEAGFYAVSMGSIILFVIAHIAPIVPGLRAARLAAADVPAALPWLDVLVISAGAGFHEELLFRLLGVGGAAWLIHPLLGRTRAFVVAVLLSSLAFALAHHIGPAGEPFTFAAFVYRSLAGVFFALVYRVRGFAVAAWSHALYDVYVLGLG